MSMYSARSTIFPIAVCDPAIVCIHTSSPLPHLLLVLLSPTLLLDSMSGPWMHELADAEDAATEAAYTAAHHDDQVPPPMAKAAQVAQQPTAAPIQIDETPTEPATSPRHADPEVREWPGDLQLPTREHGPHPEPERYATRYVMNDGQWTPEEHEQVLRKALKQSMSMHGIEHRVKKLNEPTLHMLVKWKSGKPASKQQASKRIH